MQPTDLADWARPAGRPDPLPELDAVERLVEAFGHTVDVQVIGRAVARGRSWPIHGLSIGARGRVPTLCLVGGVHGVERVGTHVVLAFLATLAELARWDPMMQAHLRRVRVCAVPLVNPVGMSLHRRGNGRGVDLMRNAPVGDDALATPWVGGQRVSPLLPWYMGPADGPMEPEACALLQFVRDQVFSADPALLLDLHSGFGSVDRLWFPWARTRRPFPHVAEVHGLRRLLDRTLPNHVYRVEPIARVYTVRGDLWDHAYDEHRAAHPERLFLPLTLEMGSWAWVRKNPRQLLSLLGGFNPMREHRLRRVMRRHLPLLDFLLRAVAAPSAWAPRDDRQRRTWSADAFATYFA